MRTFLTFILALVILSVGLASNAKSVKYTIVHYTVLNEQSVVFSTTQKGLINCVNGSFFNVNTRKMVPVGLKNRVFIVRNITGISFSDNLKDIKPEDEVISAGSWLILNGKEHSTKDGFSQQFKSVRVNRTLIAKKGSKVFLFVVTNASLSKCRRILLDMQMDSGLALDGGSSSTFKKNGKVYIQGKRCVNYIGG